MKKKGFTLIEMMIALAIFSLFVGFLYNAYFTQIKENNSFNNRLDLKYNGDKAMNLITDELRSNTNLKLYNNDIIIIPIPGSYVDVNKVKTGDGITILIDLTGSAVSSKLQLTSQNTLRDNTNVLCKGITSITMKYKEDLILISINLQLKNDQYTVTSAVNINK